MGGMSWEVLAGLAIVFCTAHLTMGFWGGYVLGTSRRMAADGQSVAPSSPRVVNCGVTVRQLEILNDRLAELARQSGSQLPPVSDRVLSAIDDLVKFSRNLRDHAAKAEETAGQTASSPSKRYVADGHTRPVQASGALSRGELVGMTDEEVEPDETSEKRRFAYNVFQFIAPCINNELPDPHEFVPVRCHDLSVCGVSFYAQEPPGSDEIVISLGERDDMLFTLARVMNLRKTYREGELQYFVGVQFVRRLPEGTFHWNGAQGRIEGDQTNGAQVVDLTL